MGKGDNRDRKDTKKAPQKTLKEKRAEKRAKKQESYRLIPGQQPQSN
jgi:hypothetical protein